MSRHVIVIVCDDDLELDALQDEAERRGAWSHAQEVTPGARVQIVDAGAVVFDRSVDDVATFACDECEFTTGDGAEIAGHVVAHERNRGNVVDLGGKP